MFFGKAPNKKLLENYGLLNYFKFVDSYKMGNLKLFEEALDELEERFILLGTFLIAEKLKSLVFRNLVLKIHKNYDCSGMNIPFIPIELI
jgi:hypothetical protein